MESPDSLLSAHHHREISKELKYVGQRLEGTPEYCLDDYLLDEDDHIDDAIRTLRSRGLTDADIEKARRWNRPPMYALQDTAQFNLLLEASKSIGAKHTKAELKRAFLRQDFEAKSKYLRGDQKPAKLLRALEEQNADEGTLVFCRDALQGGKAAQDAATRLVELIVKELRASRKSQVETWQNRTRAGVKKEGRSKMVKKRQ
ncbi:hypothetical protein DL98DRAFT_523045 [Cadophora sp. DSE1049]|nr:hypothetical protein DL98DRAFT_523044 [Cadophora sp. DSE1049]PVH67939.1 hypothetical protein DL98DRAFT_523045 [Cadophora sp. DSE1049]